MRTLEITRKWALTPLGEAGVLARGRSKHRPRNAKELLGGPYPLIQTGDVANAGLVLKEFHSTYSELGLAQSKMWPAGTLCITIAANIADTAILGFDACFPDSVVGFTPHESICDVRFVQFWLMYTKRQIEDSATEVAQKNINLKILSDLKIPLPPLEEQQRIAEILDLADGLRAKRREALAEVEELTQAVFWEMFGDVNTSPRIDRRFPLKELKSIADIRGGLTLGRKLDNYETVERPYLRVANVQDGYLELDEIKTIDVKVGEVGKYLLKPGDVLMTEGGDYDKLGRGALWNGEIENCVHQNHLFKVRTKKAIDPVYFSVLIRSRYAKDYFLRSSKKTTNLATINSTQLKAFKVPLPPINLQKTFAERVEGIEKLKASHQRSLEEMDALFASLQSRAFKGEL